MQTEESTLFKQEVRMNCTINPLSEMQTSMQTSMHELCTQPIPPKLDIMAYRSQRYNTGSTSSFPLKVSYVANVRFCSI